MQTRSRKGRRFDRRWAGEVDLNKYRINADEWDLAITGKTSRPDPNTGRVMSHYNTPLIGSERDWQQALNNLRCPYCLKPAVEGRSSFDKAGHNGFENNALVRLRNYTCIGFPPHTFSSQEIHRPMTGGFLVQKKTGHAEADSHPDGVPFDLQSIAAGIQAAGTKSHTHEDAQLIAGKVFKRIQDLRDVLSVKKVGRQKYYFDSASIGKIVLIELCRLKEATLFYRFAIVFFDMNKGQLTFGQLRAGVERAWLKAELCPSTADAFTKEALRAIDPGILQDSANRESLARFLPRQHSSFDRGGFPQVEKRIHPGQLAGRLQDFDFEKLVRSLEKAAPKSSNHETSVRLAMIVCDSLREKYPLERHVRSSDIGRCVLTTLRRMGFVAMWVRFALVSLAFTTDSRMEEISQRLADTWADLDQEATK